MGQRRIVDKAHCASEEGRCSIKLEEEGQKRQRRRRIGEPIDIASRGNSNLAGSGRAQFVEVALAQDDVTIKFRSDTEIMAGAMSRTWRSRIHSLLANNKCEKIRNFTLS